MLIPVVVRNITRPVPRVPSRSQLVAHDCCPISGPTHRAPCFPAPCTAAQPTDLRLHESMPLSSNWTPHWILIWILRQISVFKHPLKRKPNSSLPCQKKPRLPHFSSKNRCRKNVLTEVRTSSTRFLVRRLIHLTKNSESRRMC